MRLVRWVARIFTQRAQRSFAKGRKGVCEQAEGAKGGDIRVRWGGFSHRAVSCKERKVGVSRQRVERVFTIQEKMRFFAV